MERTVSTVTFIYNGELFIRLSYSHACHTLLSRCRCCRRIPDFDVRRLLSIQMVWIEYILRTYFPILWQEERKIACENSHLIHFSTRALTVGCCDAYRFGNFLKFSLFFKCSTSGTSMNELTYLVLWALCKRHNRENYIKMGAMLESINARFVHHFSWYAFVTQST